MIILTAIESERRAVGKTLRLFGIANPVIAIGIAAARFPPNIPSASIWILAGLGGALDPSLNIGDVILDDPHGLVPNSVPIRRGKIHTAKKLIATPQAKAEAFTQSTAAMVDMEQSIIQQKAAAQGALLIGVRAVSDTADDSVDPAVLTFVDDLGHPLPLAIAMGLLKRPALISQLRRLQKNSAIALDQLGQAVSEILMALPAMD